MVFVTYQIMRAKGTPWYETIIKVPHDIWNHRTVLGRRGPEFELIWRRLVVPLSWCLSWFFTMKVVEWIHLSYNTWWEEVTSTDDTVIIFVSNTPTEFVNTILSHAANFNNCMYRCCIIFDGRLRTQIMSDMNWSGQFCWRSNNI